MMIIIMIMITIMVMIMIEIKIVIIIIIIIIIIITIIIAQRCRNTSRLYIHDLIMVALAIMYSAHLGIQNNATICLSDHKTIDSQCPITNAQSNLYWISYIYSWLPVGGRSGVINCTWRGVAVRFPSNRTSTGWTKKNVLFMKGGHGHSSSLTKKNYCWWIAPDSPHSNCW